MTASKKPRGFDLDCKKPRGSSLAKPKERPKGKMTARPTAKQTDSLRPMETRKARLKRKKKMVEMDLGWGYKKPRATRKGKPKGNATGWRLGNTKESG